MRDRTKLKPPVPLRDERPLMGLTSGKNWVNENASLVIPLQKSPPSVPEVDYLQKPDFGKVPGYLRQLQEEQKQQRKDASTAESLMISGESEGTEDLVQLLPEEVAQLLQHVQEKKNTVQTAYYRLPSITETLSQRRAKQELEKELAALDEDLELLQQIKAQLRVPEEH